MRYLLDVNVLVAWGWQDHVDHARVDRWLASLIRARGSRLMTSAIPELGFVRVSIQRGQGQITPDKASGVLRGMLDVLGKTHGFLADDVPSGEWPEWCGGASRTTDAHLLLLAEKHGLRLATLDQGIPGAYLLPD